MGFLTDWWAVTLSTFSLLSIPQWLAGLVYIHINRMFLLGLEIIDVTIILVAKAFDQEHCD